MDKKNQKRIIQEMTNGVKERMLKALKDGHVPVEWDGFQLRHWMLSIVRDSYAYQPLTGKVKKDFKNHLIINPNL